MVPGRPPCKVAGPLAGGIVACRSDTFQCIVHGHIEGPGYQGGANEIKQAAGKQVERTGLLPSL